MKPTCEVCGKTMSYGHTDDHGNIYVCEECFEKYMDKKYGKHCWMYVSDDGNGGYILASSEDEYGKGETFGTGIYWTTFE